MIPMDPTRLSGSIGRTILYFGRNKQCARCDGQMDWHDVEVHHVLEHSQGGATSLDNGAAVHKACHPKGATATAAFAAKFATWKAAHAA